MTHDSDQIHKYMVEKPLDFLCEKVGRFLEKHCVHWKVILIAAIYTYFLFWYVLADVPWVVWKQMLQDYLLIIALPLYLAVFSETINNIYQFSIYQTQNLECDIDALSKDVYLSIWEEIKYYPFLDKKTLKPCHFEGDKTNILKELRKYVGDDEKPRCQQK